MWTILLLIKEGKKRADVHYEDDSDFISVISEAGYLNP